MRTLHYIFFAVFIFIFLCAAQRHESSFSKEEKMIIGTDKDSIMRVWLTTNYEDSLFLRRKAKLLSEKEIRSSCFETLKKRMLYTVNDTVQPGVGIAAPQVGISRCLIAVQRFDKPGEPFEFYINPRLVYMSERKKVGKEGCLSIPDRMGMVARSTDIVVRYVDESTLQEKQDTVSGFTAVIFQHEIDHLSGILYIDKLSN